LTSFLAIEGRQSVHPFLEIRSRWISAVKHDFGF